MATENIIMAMVAKSGDRQECHDKIGVLWHEATLRYKMEGKPNNLLGRIRKDSHFASIIDRLVDPLLHLNRFCLATSFKIFSDQCSASAEINI